MARKHWLNDWCMLCYDNVRGRSNHRGHKGYICERRKKELDMSQFIQKPGARDESEHMADMAILNSGLMLQCPAVMEYLTVETYPDGGRRQRATMLLLVEEGLWKVSLHDRDNARSVWLSGDAMESAILSLEAALVAGRAEWRKAGPNRRK